MQTHCEIEPIKVFVYTKFFYDGELPDGEEEFTVCDIFAISSYKGSCPTFVVKIRKNGAIFHYIPIQAILEPKEKNKLPFPFIVDNFHKPEILCDYNCLDNYICINYFSFLKGECTVFLNNKLLKQKGKYILTIDWPQSNYCLNLVQLDNSQFCLVPNYRILFSKNSSWQPDLPKYRKIRSHWRA